MRIMSQSTTFWCEVLLLVTVMVQCQTSEVRWDHSVDLDENFRLLWRIKAHDIIIELQVRTLGYVGFGFARSDLIYGADMVVGWVDNKHTFFQVSSVNLIKSWRWQRRANWKIVKFSIADWKLSQFGQKQLSCSFCSAKHFLS